MAVPKSEQNRKLSAAEQARTEQFETLIADLAKKGYVRHDLTVGLVAANILGFASTLPICALFVWGFVARNGWDNLFVNSLSDMVLVLAVFVVLIFVHEGLHGLTWAAFSKNHFADIEFGFIKQMLTPYCTCKTPLTRAAYVLGAAMPLIVLGVVPSIVAIFIGSGVLLSIGLLMVLAAGGDVLIIVKALLYRAKSSDVLLCDHPTQAGCVVFEKEGDA